MKAASIIAQEGRISSILHKYGVLQAAIFGSYARDEANIKSDVDILVLYPVGTTLFDVMELQNELEQAIGRKVDLVSQKHLTPRLKKRIASDLKPLIMT